MKLFRVLGLTDSGGESLSFNKMITLGAGLTFVFAIVWGLVSLRTFAPTMVWTFGLVVIGAGFGLKGYLAGIGRVTQQNTATETTVTTIDAAKVIEAIRARRDPKLGQEDSGRVPETHHD